MTYTEKLRQRIAATQSNLCVGLDVRAEEASQKTLDWIQKVIDETAEHTAAYKPNSAYFEALGWRGMELLEKVIARIPKDIPVVLDCKRGDIGETQAYYARAAFEQLGADAVTLNAYMGADTIEPFLAYPEKGIYLLGVTSNLGAAHVELQSLSNGRQVFELIAAMTRASDQVGLVLGLTNAAESILERIPDVPLLIPGLGAQGGDLTALSQQARQAALLINVSRGILYAQPETGFADKAAHWKNEIRASLLH